MSKCDLFRHALTLVDNIISFLKECGTLFHRDSVVEFNFEDTFLEFTVVNDTDIFNADLLHRKDSGNRSNTAGLRP